MVQQLTPRVLQFKLSSYEKGDYSDRLNFPCIINRSGTGTAWEHAVGNNSAEEKRWSHLNSHNSSAKVSIRAWGMDGEGGRLAEPNLEKPETNTYSIPGDAATSCVPQEATETKNAAHAVTTFPYLIYRSCYSPASTFPACFHQPKFRFATWKAQHFRHADALLQRFIADIRKSKKRGKFVTLMK